MLARREHCAGELRQKLIQKGFQADEIERQLAALQAERLLDDHRYTEMYVRVRREKGYGPFRIQQELRQRGVDDAVVADWLDPDDSKWMAEAQRARIKRFGSKVPTDQPDRLRQWRFLQYRGFTSGQIKTALRP